MQRIIEIAWVQVAAETADPCRVAVGRADRHRGQHVGCERRGREQNGAQGTSGRGATAGGCLMGGM
jgi:hypothetical protein